MHGGMDSKEDIYYDTSDSESLDDLCSDFNEMEMASNGTDDNDDDDDERGYDHYEKYTLQPCQQNYIILSEADIHRHQDDDITAISSVLSLSRASSSTLIHHFKWSVSEVYNAWFADEEKVRKVVGLLDKPVAEIPENVKQLTCRICFETHPLDIMAAASCGHLFCATCWAGYISTSINNGPACLMLRCPDPSCDAAVDSDMIDQLASDKDKEKYSRYFHRSYIETKRNAKWCPAPGCGYAVEFEVGSCGSYDVTCHCSYNFCWTCTEEIHRPVDCDTVAKWILKHGSEAENIKWLLANSKPCPKCNRPIEKNHGCMHMTCTPPCGFEFCWLCLNPWSEHDDITGDYYLCNIYEIAKAEGTYDEAETRREMALNSLDRYVHYYERWASNQSSRQKASADLHQIQTRQLKELGHREGLSEMELEAITEAWLQIVECRRMLKWTYAYGYYIPEHDDAKRQFFEYLQGQAESGLERLHQCAEKELKQYLEADRPTPGFHDFHTKLVRLTRVTRNYFENLVQALENGLSDVVCIKACSSKSLEGGKDTGRECHRRTSKFLGWCSHGWSH